MSTEPVEVHVEVPVPEPEPEPVAETPSVVVVNNESDDDGPAEGTVGVLVDHAEEIATLRARVEEQDAELDQLRAAHAVTEAAAVVAVETASEAAAVADAAANPPVSPDQDEEPNRRSKFHNWFFGRRGAE